MSEWNTHTNPNVKQLLGEHFKGGKVAQKGLIWGTKGMVKGQYRDTRKYRMWIGNQQGKILEQLGAKIGRGWVDICHSLIDVKLLEIMESKNK